MTNYDAPSGPTEALHEHGAGLEFPDWSGMADRPLPVPPAVAFRWNEELRALFPPGPHRAEDAAAAKCVVEFVL
jgi:hypothetical protein